MSKSSFYEILEDRIREDLRAEIEKEIEKKVEAKLRRNLGADGSTNFRSEAQNTSQTNAWAKSAAERVETWLASNVDPFRFRQNSRPASQAYARDAAFAPKAERQQSAKHTENQNGHRNASRFTKAANTEDSTAKESTVQNTNEKIDSTGATYHATTVEELCAVELLARYGGGLSNPFSEKDLKSSWRKAALKTHPDRFANADGITQTQTAVLFRELSKAFDTLEARMITSRTLKAA